MVKVEYENSHHYECAELVAENCPQTAANAKMSQVVRGLRGTAVLKLSEVCMSCQYSYFVGNTLVKRKPM